MNNSSYGLTFRLFAITLLMAQSFLSAFVVQGTAGVSSDAAVSGLVNAQTTPVSGVILGHFDIHADGTAEFNNSTPVSDPNHPFDCSGSTWNDSNMGNGNNDGGSNQGLDSCQTNGIVRLNDSVTYRVDVSVDDADQNNVTAVVELPDTTANGDPRSIWLELPEECLTGSDENGVAYAPQSSLSADGAIMTCNFGNHSEGTKLVLYPQANANPVNANDDQFSASVCLQSDNAAGLCLDPVSVITTATFGIDLIKILNPAENPPITSHVPFPAKDPDGSGANGMVLTYKLLMNYIKGSELLSGTGLRDFDLIDTMYIEDISGVAGVNNIRLYQCDFGDTIGAGSCSQASASDSIYIDLDNVDTTLPNGGSTIAQIDVKLWVPQSDFAANGVPDDGNLMVFNNILIDDGGSGEYWSETSVSGVSATENITNNEEEYLLGITNPGGWIYEKSFYGTYSSPAFPKTGEFPVAVGETVGMTMYIQGQVGASSACDKLDYINTDFIGMQEPLITDRTLAKSAFYNDLLPRNPNLGISIASFNNSAFPENWVDPNDYGKYTIEYSTVGHDIANPEQALCDALPVGQQKNSCFQYFASCEDDIDGDGANDWIDASLCDPVLGGDRASCGVSAGDIKKIRLKRDPDLASIYADSVASPGNYRLVTNFDIKIKDGPLVIEPSQNNALGYIGNFSTPTDHRGVILGGHGVANPRYSADYDPLSDGFARDSGSSLVSTTADRLRLVAATTRVVKDTIPSDLQFVEPGEIHEFSLTPTINGSRANTTTVSLNDVLPTQLTYVGGTLQEANCGPGQTVTYGGNVVDGSQALSITINDVDPGEVLCEFTYQAKVDDFASTGSFINTVTVSSPVDTESELTARQSKSTLTILPGLDKFKVWKIVPQELYALNTSFTYDLIYRNAGVTDQSAGSFIDVLPYNGDGGLGGGVCDGTQTSTSGVSSCRIPATDFTGTYTMTSAPVGTNGESFMYTTADPTMIEMDTCHVSNHPVGVPLPPYCPLGWVGGAAPTGTTVWTTTFDPNATAFRFDTTAYPTGQAPRSVELSLTPTGNAANDIYTNSFGGRIPEIFLPVISNDVFVTTVSFDLALDKVVNTTLSPAPYLPGDSVVYDITVYNQGTYDADGIEIIDYIPAGLTLDTTTAINTANGWTAAGTTTVPAIPAGGSETVQIELTIDGTVTEGSIVNWSEITAGIPVDENGVEITTGIGLVDGDSTPDSTQFNGDGETDDLDDDNVIDESGLDTANDGDEDDHDPAEITIAVFDLALTKVLATTGAVAPGDDVTFTIELHNQGDLDGYNIEVTDHIPAGLTLNDPNWTASGTDMATYTYMGPLAASGSDMIDITMTVDATFTGTSLTNWAEISSADNDTDATNGLPTDLDSTPNADNFSEAGETDDLDDDNVIDGDGNNGGDEDDHDPAQLTITQTYDLALTKTYKEYADLDADNTISQGDEVTFNVSIMNQGTLPAANIEVSDYIPTGMTLSANDANGWTPGAGSTGTVTNVVAGPIMPGMGETLEIVLTIDPDFQGFALTNWAEISADDAASYGGIGITADVDSTPDADQFNTPGETDDLDDDNVIDEDGNDTANDGDEDDHDPAMIPVGQVFDLALTKTLMTTGTIEAGDDVLFAIEVFNQGSLNATDVVITDYIPVGMTLSANDTNGWVDAGTTATTTIASIPQGQSTTVDIVLTVDASFTQGDLINWAEISDDNAGIHGDGVVDIDSTPDAENMNTGGEVDGLVNDNVTDNTNGDEDDHDPAMITVSEYDLALIQEYLTYTDTNGDGVLSAGDDVTFKITVNNQGNLDAANIDVTNYIPAGTSLSANDANGWGAAGDTGSVTQTIGSLPAGGMTMVQIVLTIDETFQGTEIINWAEISADNAGDYGISDSDSTPDADQFNTPGETDDLDDNNINDEDGNDTANDGDEDDHDPSLVMVDQFFDLALNKKLITEGIIKPGDVVTFEIEVTNQGSLDATNVVISDYIPGGLTLQADATWSMNGANAEAMIASLPGLAGAVDPSVILTINFVADGSAAGWVTNWAEISSATDREGNAVTDIDSTPDADNGEEGESSVDDAIDEDGKNGGDEDDHDLEEVRLGVFDLALRKTLDTAQLPVYQGENVTFQIEVFNQGNLDATDVEITDYIPIELALNDADWTDNGTTATYIIDGPILPQTSVVVDITMTIDPDYQGNSITNWAEISSSDNDGDASTPAIPDDDSTEDNNQTNDGYDGADNVIDERGVDGGDEDDHDPEQFPVGQIYDLALAKTIASEGPYMQGEEVTFTLEVTNQGTLDASGIELTDYIPTGLVLADADWTANGDTATYLIPGTLAHGDSTTVDITFTIISGDGELTNWAEISVDNAASYAGIGITADVDSTPDANNGEAGESPINDAIDGTGGDEDDHDLETIQLQSTNNSGGGNNNSPTPVFESAPEVEEVEVIAEVIEQVQESTAEIDGCIHYYEAEHDGSYEGDEGISGMPVSLTDENGNVVATTVTDADGCYHFKDLLSGEYCTHYENTSSYTADSSIPGSIDPSTGEGPSSVAEGMDHHCGIQLDEGEHSVGNDFGLTDGTAEIDGCIHHDINADGIYDENDTGLEGMPVQLKDIDGKVIGTMETDENGCYHFVELPAGEYCVHYEDMSADYDPVSSNPGAVDPETGEAISSVAIGEMTHCVELQNGYYSASNDFGLAFKETEVHQSAAAPLSLPAILPQTGAEVK